MAGSDENDIAIVGMGVRFPGARSPNEFWSNLKGGVCSIAMLKDEDLIKEGVSRGDLEDPSYVKAAAILDEMEWFDAEFFGLSPKDAAIMDPQHRNFLECAWEALEDSGHPPDAFEGSIGVFAGCGMGSYFMFNVLSNPDLIASVGMFLLRHTGNDKDFLATRCSYAFNLTGPSINIQTACSTSLVAAHTACQSLLNYECDMALAGGVTIELPHRQGYFHKEGEILSPDGYCRAFDHRARGTVFGSGAGLVVLRRLEDALTDGDRVYAVIKGSAVNNDGSGKAGYLAPSVDGQAAAVAEALAVARVTADSIGLIEAHGTGTAVGDPIEIKALTQAFRQTTAENGFCGIGSVKTNIGHLDTAAGSASLIKAALALYHKEMPPSLHFEKANPSIDFENSPFYVVAEPKPWDAHGGPRRAGVNSLGVGGTNAHFILEEAPPAKPAPISSRPFHLLQFSARNRASVEEFSHRLAHELEPDVNLAQVAHQLRVRRKNFQTRCVLACRDRNEAAKLLADPDPERVFFHQASEREAPVIFMFPGGGAQFPGMGRGLYESEPIYRDVIDRGLVHLAKLSEYDYRGALFPIADSVEDAAVSLERPSVQLPLLFLVEYAMAQLWLAKGVRPAALIGHSMGENAAACLAGVFSFEDALGLVHLRGSLFERLSEGGMLSVHLTVDQIREHLPPDLDWAVVNGPEAQVVSGPIQALDRFAVKLDELGVDYNRIRIKVAAHSRMLEPLLEPFRAYLTSIQRSEPSLPIISNRTGAWMTPEQAVDPDYWTDHLRHTVNFGDGMSILLERSDQILIEIGPGFTLGSLARMQTSARQTRAIIPSLPRVGSDCPDAAHFLTALGRIWASGGTVPTESLGDSGFPSMTLPTYSFDRQRYWIESGKTGLSATDGPPLLTRREKTDDWFYRPIWQESPTGINHSEPEIWLIFLDESGIGRRISERLIAEGHKIVTVREGDTFHAFSDTEYVLSPERGASDYGSLIQALVTNGVVPKRILHLWLLTPDESFRPGSSFFHRNQERGFYSAFFLAKAMGDENLQGELHLMVAANGLLALDDERLLYPEKATVLGPCGVIPREFPGVTCKVIDINLPKPSRKWLGGKPLKPQSLERAVELLLEESKAEPENQVVALRNGRRWVRSYQRGLSGKKLSQGPGLRQGGVYLITGGFGGLGLALADYLARHYRAKLILIARPPFPERGDWDAWLQSHSAENKISARIQAVRDLESNGASVLIAPADVTDFEAMQNVVADALARFEELHGVLHTAGVLKDGLIQTKEQADTEDVFSPKIQGTLVLDEVLKDVNLDFMVLFSSISTVVLPAGQADYVAANEFLNAYAQSRAGRGRRYTVATGWGLWNKIGMTAEIVARFKRGSTKTTAVTHPLLQSRVHDGGICFQATLSVEKHWFLSEHRTAEGAALAPGVSFIEMARAALAEQGEHRFFEIADLFFLRPLFVADRGERKIRVKLVSKQEEYGFEVQSLYQPKKGASGWETHVLALLKPCGPPERANVELEELLADYGKERDAGDKAYLETGQWRHMKFGPRWRVLRSLRGGRGKAMAHLLLPTAFNDDLEVYRLHPALLDMATGYAMDLIDNYQVEEGLWVPVSYKSIRMYGVLPASIWSEVRIRDNEGSRELANFDVRIFDDQGRILLEIEEFTIKKMGRGFSGSREPTPNDLEYATAAEPGVIKLSPAELALRNNLEQGILPEEGMSVLDQILNRGVGSRVLISPLSLEAQTEQAASLASSIETVKHKFARPRLASQYAAPEDEIEKTLVAFWEELLGVDQVGVEDSFFELGGHSLVAVRLFAKIKETFHVAYPISVLFEAPTIRRCAAMIREATRVERSGEAPASKRRHTHLVSMHAGNPGKNTPFFLVAGMFGNVLNLRHLAHLIGTDRPFYGLQARGLYGEAEPHTRFKEMAADYLAEVRSIQPRGPYLIGGFSGGGITAYEMARQLLAQGEEVGLLVMLDTPLAQRPRLERRDKLKIHWQRFREKGLAYFSEWALNRLRWEAARFRSRFELDPETDVRVSDFHSQSIENAFREALRHYRLPKYPGKIMLFRPKLDQRYLVAPGRYVSSELELVYPDNGWTPYVGEVVVHEVPGNHDSMVLEPNVRTLAAHLAACIEEAEQEKAPLQDSGSVEIKN